VQASRREFVGRTLCGCLLGSLWQPAAARVLATDLTPLVSSGYRPTDADERGLWQACDRLEQQVASSGLLLSDAALKSYIRGVLERLLDGQATDLRIYPIRNPEFNASMTPNGMLMVHTGLLVRMRNEAQFAAVLGHESGHYLRRHSVKNWRDIKHKTAAMSVAAMFGVAGLAVNMGLAMSLFSFSRELESEADAYGLQLLKGANYPPGAAGEIWAQLIGERKASARERNKLYKDRSTSALSTHPPTEERMRDLTETAAALAKESAAAHYDARREAWLAAVAPLRPMLLEEQVKLNEPGASLYLLESLAQDGWDGLLRYYEGETYRLRAATGDSERAAQAYAAAVAAPDAPPEAFRAHGYALLRGGNGEEGRRALTRYLELAPHAVDADMVRFSLNQH